MKSLKSYNKNVFQPPQRRLNKFYNFFSGGGYNANNPPPCLRAFLYRCQNRKYKKNYMVFGSKVVRDSDFWNHDLQNSKSTLLIIIIWYCCDHVTSKSNHFIFAPNSALSCIFGEIHTSGLWDIEFAKFSIWSRAHIRMDGPRARTQNAFGG